MKRLYASILFSLGLGASAMAQTFDYPYVRNFGTPAERFLGLPNTAEGTQLVPLGIDLWEGDENNTIHYGAVPANASAKPVIVFVHGYASNARVWFEGEDNMYADVYRDGYRTAFVSLTPNNHIWTNGYMLSKALERITARYGVSKVILVGWSKGGVDCDAALNHYGARSRVSQAFTLSTPHHGTAIAELANSVLLTFVNIIFMQDNDATRSLQRGYMDYFRSVTDGRSTNTVPFTTIGAWGNGPLARLAVPQELLYWNGGSQESGGNDGVVPYSSSRRPGGRELFSGQRKEYYWWGGWYYTGPSQTNLDHYEVTRGGLVWPYIKANISSANRTDIPSAITEEQYNPNAEIESRMQVVSAMRGKKTFFVEPNAGQVQIIMGTAGAANYRISRSNGTTLPLPNGAEERLANGVIKQAYTFENLEAGQYEVSSDEPFVAIVLADKGITARLGNGLTGEKRVYEAGESMDLWLSLSNEAGEKLAQAQVTGLATRVAKLDASKVEESSMPIAFVWRNGRFEAEWKGAMKPGIYNITVHAQGKEFQKTAITSVAVTGEAKAEEAATGIAQISAYPNPFVETLTVEVNIASQEATLAIYNINGQEVRRFALAQGQQQVQWDAQGMEAGLYILQLTDGSKQTSAKVVLK